MDWYKTVNNERTVILIANEPSFFEREATWFNRRGVDVFCANDLVELTAIMSFRVPSLVIAAGPPDCKREHEFRTIVPEAIPLLILARHTDDKRQTIMDTN